MRPTCLAALPCLCSGALAALLLSLAAPVRAESNEMSAPAGSAVPSTTEGPSAAQQAPASQPWAGSVELYGFGPLRTTGDTTVRGFTAESDVTLGEALPLFEFGYALRGSIEHDRLGMLTDLSYVRLGAEKIRTIDTPGPGGFSGRGEMTTVQGLYDVALRYRFGDRETAVGRPGQFNVIPYAGIRIVQASLGVSADLNNGRLVKEGTLDRTWVQPLLGTQAGVFLSPRVQLFARADVGGFGLSGSEDLSGNAQVGLGFAVGNSTQLRFSWRYFGVNYNNGGTPDNGFSSDQNGLEAGLKVTF
jgi:hypothetical protein